MRKTSIIIILCFIAGLGGGLLLRKSSISPSEKGDGSARAASTLVGDKRDARTSREDEIVLQLPKEQREYFFEDYDSWTYEQVRQRLLELNEACRYGGDDEELLQKLCRRWGKLSPKKALMEMREMSGLRRRGVDFIFYSWSESDPKAAGQYYKENRDDFRGKHMVDSLVENWTKYSPEETWEFISSLKKEDRLSSLPSFVKALVANDTKKLTKYLLAVEDDLYGKCYFYNCDALFNEWKKKDPESYNEYVAQASEQGKIKIRGAELIAVLNDNPAQAGRELRALSKEDQESVLSWNMTGVLREKLGLTGSFDWLEENADKEVSLKLIAGRSHSSEYQNVETWLSALPEGERKNTLVEKFCSGEPAPGYDLTNVMKMVQAMPEGYKRNQSMENVMKRWIISNPEGARKWLESASGWSPEKQQEWKDQINRKNTPLLK